MNNRRLFPCELHCHTLHSDGSFAVSNLIAAAKERRLEGVSLTDHNTFSGWAEADRFDFPVLKGMEWTTYFGHMKVIGFSEYVDWSDATPDNIDGKMREIKKQDTLIGIAHPFQLGTPVCTGGHWDFKVRDYSLVDYLEIWSEGCPYMNTANTKAVKMWHDLLDEGYRITPTFGRDWHSLTDNHSPAACTYLLCDEGDLTPEKMKQAIRYGRTVVSVGPEFLPCTEEGLTLGDTLPEGETRLSFKTNDERMKKVSTECVGYDIIRVVTNRSVTLSEVSAEEGNLTFTLRKGHWYSFELWGTLDGKECLLAVTAPIYCE